MKNNFFHGILEVENIEISLPKKNICPYIEDPA
jgi:hypothetical protein